MEAGRFRMHVFGPKSYPFKELIRNTEEVGLFPATGTSTKQHLRHCIRDLYWEGVGFGVERCIF